MEDTVFLLRKVFDVGYGAIRFAYLERPFFDYDKALNEKQKYGHDYTWDIVRISGDSMTVVDAHTALAEE